MGGPLRLMLAKRYSKLVPRDLVSETRRPLSA